MLAGAAIVWQARFSADMSFFLPTRPTPEQQVLVDQMQGGAVSRLLMIGIGGGDAGQRAALSRRLQATLAASPDFTLVQNGEHGTLDRARDELFAHRYLLSPAVTPGRFTPEGLQAAISNHIDRLGSPLGLALKPLFPADPTGELVEVLRQLDPGTQPASREGVWASRDGELALLIAQTAAAGADTDGQATAIAHLQANFAAAAAELLPGATLLLSGPGVFAVDARETIRDEITRLSALSMGLIALLLLVVYRSPRLLAAGLLPVASGTLAGIAAVALAFDTVFGVTVGFGAALIGEAVDYGIYYFIQSGRLGVAGWQARFWPTIRLGVLTSLAGFGTLLLSGFPGLAQLGLYALAGLATAALVTYALLPRLAGEGTWRPDLAPLGRRLAAALALLPRGRGLLLMMAMLAAALLLSQRDALWTTNLSVLSTVREADAAVDAALRAGLGAPDARYMVVLTAPGRDAALVAAEAAGQRLDALIREGIIGGYDNPARFLPSQAAQQARQAALPDPATLQAALAAAAPGLPLAVSRLEPFVDAVAAARQQPLLDRATLGEGGLGLLVDSLLAERDGRWTALLPLRPVGGTGHLTIPADQVRAALAGSGALFIDLKQEVDGLYGDYLEEAVRLALGGGLAIVALLAFSLRDGRRLLAVCLPLACAVTILLATLHLAGLRLHLLHLVGLLLVVAVGSNYALFFDHAARHPDDDPSTLASMAIASLTTAIGFGTLALSSVPVLQALGVTVGPGALLALLFAAVFVPRGTGR